MKRLIVLLAILPLFACGGGGGGGGTSGGGTEGAVVYLKPVITINFPSDGSLIGGGTRVVTVEGEAISYLSNEKIDLLIDNALVATTECVSPWRIDFDASKLASGPHIITIRTPGVNTVALTSITVKVDPVEIRKQALKYLFDNNMLKGFFPGVRRWASLPITLEVSKEIVDSGYFSAYQQAANFWSKYTGITFNVGGSNVNDVDPKGKYGLIFFKEDASLSYDASIWNNVSGLTYIASIVTMRKEAANNAVVIAREIGLGIGAVGDVPTNGLVKGWMRMNPVIAEAMRILYFELYPGAPVPAN